MDAISNRLRLLLLAGAVTGVAILYGSVELAARALHWQSPTAEELEVALRRVNLDPLSLAAAGLSSYEVTGVVENLSAYMTQNPGVLAIANSECDQAKRDCDQLTRVVRAGTASAGEIQQLSDARAALHTAEAQQDRILDAIFWSGVADLTDTQQATLARIRVHGGWSVPTEFKVVARQQPVWIDLREALADERIAAKLGRDPDSGSVALLTQERADPAISTAKSNLDANLAVVTSSWRSAIAGQ